jgi:hypothetical protein
MGRFVNDFSVQVKKWLYLLNRGIVTSVFNPIEEALCWHLTWVNKEAAKLTTEQWPSFPSTKEFQSLVGENIYYGHFVSAI